MPFSYRELFCVGRTFCCCLPVRMGVIIMSLLGIAIAGILSIVLWFEVASTPDMTSGEEAGFVIAGLVETFLFVASSLGFVGAIVRKQLFVQIYAYFIYVHFVLNIGVAGYLLYIVTHFSANANAKLCQDTIKNEQAEAQCTGFLKVAQGVYFAIAGTVLLVELYVALVVTRYLNQLQHEKRVARRTLHSDNEEAFGLVPKARGRYFSLPDERNQSQTPVYSSYGPDFDPYQETPVSIREERSLSELPDVQYSTEEDYGGGRWTHSQISSDEKARLELTDNETDSMGDPGVEDIHVRRPSDDKSQTSPSFPTPQLPVDPELPRYTLSDRPLGSTTTL